MSFKSDSFQLRLQTEQVNTKLNSNLNSPLRWYAIRGWRRSQQYENEKAQQTDSECTIFDVYSVFIFVFLYNVFFLSFSTRSRKQKSHLFTFDYDLKSNGHL